MKNKTIFCVYDNGSWREVQDNDEFMLLPQCLIYHVIEITKENIILESKFKDKNIVIPIRRKNL